MDDDPLEPKPPVGISERHGGSFSGGRGGGPRAPAGRRIPVGHDHRGPSGEGTGAQGGWAPARFTPRVRRGTVRPG